MKNPPWFRPRLLKSPLFLACLVLAGVAGLPAVGSTVALDVDIEGIKGPLLRNVKSGLSMVALEGRKDLQAAAVRRAQANATEEIQLALQPCGYYSPEIQSRLHHEGNRWRAEYHVDPGPPTLLTKVQLALTGAGRADSAFAPVLKQFPLRPGERLEHAAYREGKRALELVAAERGYLDAEFAVHRVEVDPEHNRASIELLYDTGPQFVYGPVRFEECGLSPEFLRGHVPFSAGEPVRYSQLLQLQKNLGRLSYFSRVEVRALREQAESDRVPIEVGLTLAPARRYTLRGGYGTDTGPRSALGIEFRRLGSRAHRAEMEVQASRYESHAEAQYVIPWAYPRTEVVTFTLGYSALYEEYGRAQAMRAGADVERSRGRLREDYSLTFEREDFRIGVDGGVSILLLPGARWARVWADDRLDPRHGARLRLGVRAAREGVVATTSLAQLDTECKLIRMVGPRLRAIGRARAATTRVSDFHRLPPSLRYFAGGTDTVRGYGHNSLGPRDRNGDPVGAPHLLTFGLELELLLTEHWGWATFWDGGDAIDTWATGLAGLHFGAGSGLRWRSPIGLIRADLGWPLGVAGGPEFHLALGPEL